MTRIIALLVVTCFVVAGCGFNRVAGGAGPADQDKGYLLVSVDADFGGVLPIVPDSFWNGPVFAGLGRNQHYVFQMKTDGYSLGGVTTGTRVLRETYGTMPFSVDAGQVVYLGKIVFRKSAQNKVSWHLEDALQESLAGIDDGARNEISGLPIMNMARTYLAE